jgi:hypothetical protein
LIAVRKALKDRQNARTDFVHAIHEYRKTSDQPLTLRGSEYAHAVQELNKAIDGAEKLLQWLWEVLEQENTFDTERPVHQPLKYHYQHGDRLTV